VTERPEDEHADRRDEVAKAPVAPDTAADAPAQPAADAPVEPTAEELAGAQPARLRHAPRFGRFIGAGVALGLLIGLVLAIVIPPPQGVGLLFAWAYLGLPIAFVLGLAAGIFAVVADRRS